MATPYEIEVNSHHSIYTQGNNQDSPRRKLKVYFSIPDKGVNEDTGLVLFIAGFGGQATSNVYKKMRDEFSDMYNTVTIQCDYFGYEFMQAQDDFCIPQIDKDKLKQVLSPHELAEVYKDGQLNFDKFLQLGTNNDIVVNVPADLSKENASNFNDMGIMQAVDNIVAVLSVMNILYDNDCSFNSKKVIVFGQSHGAYLSYLCNALAPNLFSLIIDNSAWVYPVFLIDNRSVIYTMGKLSLIKTYEYSAKTIVNDKEMLNLQFLYSKFTNNCNIISYHGSTDNLVNCKDKEKLCKMIDKCIYNEISQDKVDNVIFKSTNHGLDADFLELFHYTMQEYNIKFEKDTSLVLGNVTFQTSKHKYLISYDNIMPEIIIS